jgi:hypothetical protein
LLGAQKIKPGLINAPAEAAAIETMACRREIGLLALGFIALTLLRQI